MTHPRELQFHYLVSAYSEDGQHWYFTLDGDDVGFGDGVTVYNNETDQWQERVGIQQDDIDGKICDKLVRHIQMLTVDTGDDNG